MRRRLEIARGLLHEPTVLFLDEPTLGLDPQTRNHLWAYIERLNRDQHITIIVTTHYMDEADRLCDEVAIIDHGRIIASDTPAALKRQLGGDVVEVESTDNARILPRIQALPGVGHAEARAATITIELDQAERRIAELVGLATDAGVTVTSIAVHKPTLEDVFLHFTGRTIRAEEASGKERMRLARKLWRR
jgi:ABC-2 type transport system ATP-binding protein